MNLVVVFAVLLGKMNRLVVVAIFKLGLLTHGYIGRSRFSIRAT